MQKLQSAYLRYNKQGKNKLNGLASLNIKREIIYVDSAGIISSLLINLMKQETWLWFLRQIQLYYVFFI